MDCRNNLKLLLCLYFIGAEVTNALSLVKLGQSVEGDDKAWVHDPNYGTSNNKDISNSGLEEGVPEDHACAKVAFTPDNGRLVCTVSRGNDVMCMVECKTNYFLHTGGQIKSNFPYYVCNKDSGWKHFNEKTAKVLDPTSFVCVKA